MCVIGSLVLDARKRRVRDSSLHYKELPGDKAMYEDRCCVPDVFRIPTDKHLAAPRAPKQCSCVKHTINPDLHLIGNGKFLVLLKIRREQVVQQGRTPCISVCLRAIACHSRRTFSKKKKMLEHEEKLCSTCTCATMSPLQKEGLEEKGTSGGRSDFRMFPHLPCA